MKQKIKLKKTLDRPANPYTPENTAWAKPHLITS